MKAKRHHLFIGTGLVAALSCGMAPLPAVAATIPSHSAPVVMSDLNAISDFTLSQTVTPKLKPGQAGDVTIRVTGNGSAATKGGATFTLTAPAGTTFTKTTVGFKYSDNWSGTVTGTLSADKKTLTVPFTAGLGVGGSWVEFTSNIQSDTNNTRSGLFTDGKFTVIEGTTFPIGLTSTFGYTADHEAVSMSQTVTPKLAAGESGTLAVRITNNTSKDTGIGATFELKAPSGTTFADAGASLSFSGSSATPTYDGTLSADRKTLTVPYGPTGGYALYAQAWAEVNANLVSDTDNTRSGVVADGAFKVTAGQAFPIGTTTKLGYDAQGEAVSISQTSTPKLAPGETGDATIRYTNNTQSETGKGAKFELTAPAGTTFASSTYKLKQDTYLTGWTLTGALSADKRTLTIDLPSHAIGANGWAEMIVSLTSDADNKRSGDITDGKMTVTGGVALPTGTTTTIAYNANYVAPKAIVLQTPALGAEVRPGATVFGGTGQPGATVTVRGTFGTLLGSGTVDAQGVWTITSTVSLVAGSYSGTVTQTAGDVVTSAVFRFTAVPNTAVTLTSPGIDAVVAAGRPTFSGTGKPGASVTVRGQYGTLLGSATVDTRGVWALTSTVSLVAGSYAGTVSQDAEGKVTTAPFKFVVR